MGEKIRMYVYTEEGTPKKYNKFQRGDNHKNMPSKSQTFQIYKKLKKIYLSLIITISICKL